MTTDVIGVAVYRIGPDGTPDGVWTVPRYAGRLGSERVTSGMPGQVAGTHRVETYDPDGRLVFHGTLEIAPEGQAWRFLIYRHGDHRRTSPLRRARAAAGPGAPGVVLLGSEPWARRSD